ncbi:MAG: hypothetical protein U0105_09425 [Candidatus Obscuribacterales bacterium]
MQTNLLTRQQLVRHALRAATERMDVVSVSSSAQQEDYCDARFFEEQRQMVETMKARRLFAHDDW